MIEKLTKKEKIKVLVWLWLIYFFKTIFYFFYRKKRENFYGFICWYLDPFYYYNGFKFYPIYKHIFKYNTDNKINRTFAGQYLFELGLVNSYEKISSEKYDGTFSILEKNFSFDNVCYNYYNNYKIRLKTITYTLYQIIMNRNHEK